MTLTYSLAPHNWAICFQGDCPLKDTCLRYAIGQLAPADLTHHATVLPAARQGDHCTLFATKEPVRIARGMTRLLAPGSTGQESVIRQGLFSLFGSRTHYYRYRNGDYDITPEQQERVITYLRRFGYEGSEPFDHYTTTYYFPKP
jgi:hypothetical protein